MRIGNYEFLKSNQWCYQIYLVTPDGWDGKAKTRKSPIDGRSLIAIECYPNTVEAAIKRCINLNERDSVDTCDAAELLAKVEQLHDSMRSMAREIANAG
ncbi:hypothetical protein [Collinsella sp. CM84Y_54]|uniref:hypothetical protein n=1 Tax=Collinsella sp. CM84Y_54 TaxID=3085309 RepID=UPI002E78DDAE|nr:hypothetical protein [Collinsella sp. CM84Y_54]